MSIQSGVVFPQQPVVDAVDATGQRVASATGTVQAFVDEGTGVLQGATVQQLVAGRATFTDLSLALPAGSTAAVSHRLRFERAGVPPVRSGLFLVAPVAPPPLVATALSFFSVPTSVVSGATFGSVVVRAVTAQGQVVPTYTGGITVSILSEVVVNTNERTVVLQATAAGLSSATSPSIRITRS